MPRAGGTYTLPFPDTVPNTTIESVKYNSTNHDIEFDLNQPRPISAGGTGGTSGDSALASLNAEKSTQIVADYNTMAFLPGSFASTATALNGPVNGHNFAGICYSSDPLPTAPNFVVTNNNLVLEARDLDDGLVGPPLTVPGTVYVRQKKAGVWGVWTKAGGLGVAPFDALAYNGMQFNGSTEVSQEFGSTGGTIVATGTNFRPCDGWVVWGKQSVGPMSIGVTRTSTNSLPGFLNAILLIANNSNFTNATSGDYLFYAHGIEGYRTSRLAWGTASAQPLSYGFWFYSTVAGVIFVRLGNSAGDRVYHQEHTVAGATWNWLTATIPGDTTGTWQKDNNAGLYLAINVAGKETTPAIPGVWGGAGKFQTTNSTNLMGTSGNQTYITGLIVIPGTQVPPSASSSLIMRPYDQELQTCQRYWQKLTINDTIWLGDGNGYGTSFPFDPMRSGPSVNTSGLVISGGSSPGGYPQFSVNANSFMMVRAQNVGATIQTISGTVILDARL